MPTARTQPAIYQLKISLERISPPVWRRVLVPSTMKLSELHFVIQSAMGWETGHLHYFSKGVVHYGEDDEYGESEARVRIKDLLTAERQSLNYLYDFGDSWRHKVVLEKILQRLPGVKYPRLVDGKNRCPPEDCGGLGGYMRLLEVLADPTHEEHNSMRDWVGEDFNPQEFDFVRAMQRVSGEEPQLRDEQTTLEF